MNYPASNAHLAQVFSASNNLLRDQLSERFAYNHNAISN